MCHKENRPTGALRSIAEIAELAGGLAHELRNPLSTVKINLKLLLELLQDESVSDCDARRRAITKIEVVENEAERLQTLFDDFLQLAGPCRLESRTLDLCVVIDSLLTFLGPVLASASAEVRWNRPSEAINCMVDARLLRQALLNLVLNAQEAMPNGGILSINLEVDEIASERCVVISVSDAGIGIAPEDADRVFRPFYSTKAKGTGLGLSITRRIVHEHGGQLSFSSNPKGGTTFSIQLPLSVDEADGD